MERSEKSSTRTSIGSLTLFMIFATLILTVMAILTYVTANNEYILAKKFETSVVNYYAADSKATDVLTQISNNQPTDVPLSQEGNIISFSVPIDEGRVLKVQLDNSNNDLKIISWNCENLSAQTYDNSMPVWTGKEES